MGVFGEQLYEFNHLPAPKHEWFTVTKD